jgi:hypothetical protein
LIVEAPLARDAVPLFGDPATYAQNGEIWTMATAQNYLVRNVTQPTLTPFLPDKATGAAESVAPGGVFMLLAIDHEGWRVARSRIAVLPRSS